MYKTQNQAHHCITESISCEKKVSLIPPPFKIQNPADH